VAGYANNIIDQFNRDFAGQILYQLQRAAITPRNWFNANLLYYWYNVPSLSGILTLLVGLLVTALSVARERELGTFDQLLVSPVSPIEILIGKTIPALIIGMMEGTVIVMVGVFLFSIPFTGQLSLLYLGMFVYLCAVVGVGLFISTLCATQQQAILGTFVFMTPAVLLSGFATPVENMPTWLQYVTYINPLRYYLVIAKGVFLKAMPAHIVLSNVWPMACIALFTLSVASWLFRRKLE
jgi:ABC-2 type transport system permease protein